MKLITSAQNEQLKHLFRLLTQAKARRESGETVLEGVHLLQTYLQSGGTPKQIYLPGCAGRGGRWRRCRAWSCRWRTGSRRPGRLHPSFLRGQIRRRCVPSSQPWGFPFEAVVCAARVQDTITVRVFFVWSLPYETHIWKWGARRVLKVIFTLKDDLEFYRLALPKLSLDKVGIPYSSPVFRGFFLENFPKKCGFSILQPRASVYDKSRSLKRLLTA